MRDQSHQDLFHQHRVGEDVWDVVGNEEVEIVAGLPETLHGPGDDVLDCHWPPAGARCPGLEAAHVKKAGDH
ncbi:hypothetical protein SHIRM173S_05625 [Streptomyces hirsutus]